MLCTLVLPGILITIAWLTVVRTTGLTPLDGNNWPTFLAVYAGGCTPGVSRAMVPAVVALAWARSHGPYWCQHHLSTILALDDHLAPPQHRRSVCLAFSLVLQVPLGFEAACSTALTAHT